jgi:F-type H+-transporting ATPase subunit b
MITFGVELVVLLVIIWLVKKYVWPMLITSMKARQEEIQAALESAANAREDAASAEVELQASLEDAKNQAADFVTQAKVTADRILAESDGRAQAEYDRIVASAQAEVSLARQRAVDDATAQLSSVVMEVVEKVISREVDASAHSALIDEAVGALGATAPISGGSN